MIWIRGTHPYSYRSGQWAHLFSIQWDEEGKDLWVVEFPDGDTDVWPSWDTAAGYDVRVQVEAPEEDPNGNQVLEERSAPSNSAVELHHHPGAAWIRAAAARAPSPTR